MGMYIQGRERRKRRIRRKVVGTPERLRMSVFRSLSHISVQIVDDAAGQTLVAASTYEKEFKGNAKTGNKESAKAIGALIAERALAKGIDKVVFDRNGCLYHGRVKELADAARQKGLKF
ncbi:MAG: 50S ribosomal protein L18 [bacterium]